MKYISTFAAAGPTLLVETLTDDGTARLRRLTEAEFDQLAERLNALGECAADERDRFAAQIRETDERAKAAEKERDGLRRQLAEVEKHRAESLAEVGSLRAECDSLHRTIRAMKGAHDELRAERDTLSQFKQYTHTRLDQLGVPHDPDPAKNLRTGCRIECRLDWVQTELTARGMEAPRAQEKEREVQSAYAVVAARLTLIGATMRELAVFTEKGPR